MIEDTKVIDSFMSDLASRLSEDTTLYVIGGCAMMYLARKQMTKDIDLVVLSEREYRDVSSALLDMGFRSMRPGIEYQRMNLSDMLIRDDGFRIDLFLRTVCRKLKLSDHMASRSANVMTFDHLSVNICSEEDIIIFKSITEREGDVTDCINLSRGILDWDYILDEIRRQVAEGEDVWIDWIANRLRYLSETHGVYVPILDTLMGMADEFMERWVAEMSAKLDEED